ncbi:hypothetical protein DdX_14462 [Ditylenchus destructor]|uniref:Uncharacterized protein n=1 Tax=Ditylenchus destructor TaxID=166010 RepID=A0AAD4MSN8_9BILA|nr:hypothetical protein DdX_14462 [Ditylenchus destructor]
MPDTPYPDLEAQSKMPQPQEQSQPVVSQNMTGTQMPLSHVQRQSQPPSVGPVRALAVDPNLGVESQYHIGVANSGIHGPANVPVAVVQQQPAANAPSSTDTQFNHIPAVPVSEVHNSKYIIGRYGERQTGDPGYQIPIELRCCFICCFVGIPLVVILILFLSTSSAPHI